MPSLWGVHLSVLKASLLIKHIMRKEMEGASARGLPKRLQRASAGLSAEFCTVGYCLGYPGVGQKSRLCLYLERYPIKPNLNPDLWFDFLAWCLSSADLAGGTDPVSDPGQCIWTWSPSQIDLAPASASRIWLLIWILSCNCLPFPELLCLPYFGAVRPLSVRPLPALLLCSASDFPALAGQPPLAAPWYGDTDNFLQQIC